MPAAQPTNTKTDTLRLAYKVCVCVRTATVMIKSPPPGFVSIISSYDIYRSVNDLMWAGNVAH